MSGRIRIVVEVEKDDQGSLKTSHRFMTPEDEAISLQWESGGLVQVAHALFVEALRREAYTMMIAQLSLDPDTSKLSLKGLESQIRAHWAELTHQLSREAAEGALRMLDP